MEVVLAVDVVAGGLPNKPEPSVTSVSEILTVPAELTHALRHNTINTSLAKQNDVPDKVWRLKRVCAKSDL